MKTDEYRHTRRRNLRVEVFDACPHCGTELSPWEKVLLSVDRALMCKHCWYRILLDAFDESAKKDSSDKTKPKGSAR